MKKETLDGAWLLVNLVIFRRCKIPLLRNLNLSSTEFKAELEEYLVDIPLENCIEKLMCFGPNLNGPNILFNGVAKVSIHL